MKNKQLFGSIMLLVAALAWGFSYGVQGMVTSTVGTFSITFFKGIGGLILIPISMLLKERFTKRTIFAGVLIGITCFLGVVFQQKGIELSTASKASFLTSLYIVFVPIIGIIIGKKAKLKNWIGVAVALVGMYFLCINGKLVLGLSDIVLLICSVMFAIQIILTDKYASDVDPVALTAVQQLTVSFLSLILMIFVEKPQVTNIVSAIWPLVFVALIPGSFAQTIQVVFQRDVEANLASLLMSFESVFGAFAGWLLLNQTLSIRELIGCGLIFIAILIAE